jgi:voltage-gated potassium channel
MLLLSAIWLLLLIIEFTRGLSPVAADAERRDLGRVCPSVHRGVRRGAEQAYVPAKAVDHSSSLALPALRLLRLVRVARLAPRTSGARNETRTAAGTINRGMRALAIGFKHRGLGYLIVLTLLIAVTGAAGMYRFELDAPGGPGFADYGTALWWTAMLLTTMGSEYWPRTPEGRFLCLLLAVYAFAVFGYVTAAIAAYFVGRDKNVRAA